MSDQFAIEKSKSNTIPLLIIGILFFIFGFVTWVNSVLIAFFQKVFDLSKTQSYLVTFAFFISYTVMAIPCSFILKKTGFRNGITVGLLTIAVGTLIFIPAAKIESFPIFLIGLFVIGAGLTILQTAANPYVTILGPRESAAQRISFMGMMNKIAGIVSQFIFADILLGNVQTSNSEGLSKVIIPYLILTIVLILLAVWIRLSHLPEVSEEQEGHELISTTKNKIWLFPNLVLGVIALFCYVGVEVLAVDTIILYGKYWGHNEDVAKYYANITLGCMTFFYIIAMVLIPKFISQQKFLLMSAFAGIIFTVCAVFTSGFTSILFIGFLGLANAVMWPSLWPLGINGLGKFTKLGSAMMIMGICGGAIIPLLYGRLAEIFTDRYAYLIAIPCYAYILFYAWVGHKKTSW